MTATLAHSHGAPTGSPSERFTSRNPDDFPVPSTAQEDWRFSPLAKLRPFFEPFEPDGVIEGEQTVPAGAQIEVVDPSTLAAFGSALTPGDRPSALAMKHARRGLHITVDAGAELAEPIVVRRTGVSGRAYTHHVVEAIFKACARALRAAVEPDPRASGVPSTKGVL